MGNSELKTDLNPGAISLKEFSLDRVIGRGGFGKFWRGTHKKSSRIFAIKEMQKIRIVKKNSVASVLNERSLLAMLKHPFIVNMQYAFQDYLNLFLVMDLVPGGDLRFHMEIGR